MTATEIVEGGTRFRLVAASLGGEAEDPEGALVVWKTLAMVDQLRRLIDEVQPERIVELGIASGGSTALLAELAPNATILAVDLIEGCPPLDQHLERTGLADRVRPHYGVDQGDGARLREVVAAELGPDPIDLVIDDASHVYEPTVASLEALFPLVRPGGCYAIEDWAWGHLEVQPEMERWLPPGPPMSRLVFELMMVMGSFRDVIGRMDGDASTLRFWRGAAAVDAATWSLGAAWSAVRPIDFD